MLNSKKKSDTTFRIRIEQVIAYYTVIFCCIRQVGYDELHATCISYSGIDEWLAKGSQRRN